MKPTNAQLALSLERWAPSDPEALRLAQGLIEYPTSTARTAEALKLLGIAPEDVPEELWPSTPPPFVPSVRSLSRAVEALSDGWDSSTYLHRLVKLRRLRWAASMTIQAIENIVDQEIAQRILDNGGSRKGIMSLASDHRQGKRPPKKPQAAVKQQTEGKP